tara:strand:+ start:87530 stop:88693 length:1164 start_codon:yes stop_codon:yes gene_type:complete
MSGNKKITVKSELISRLNLTDFRNHSNTSISPINKFIVLTGVNGSGKTNILEAISTFSIGKGLRGAHLNDLSNIYGRGGWAAFIEGVGMRGNCRLGTGFEKKEKENSNIKQCRIDGKFVNGSKSFANHIGLLWFTPVMDKIFIGPRNERRKFFDKLFAVIQNNYDDEIKRYERVMTQRNRLLYTMNNSSDKWLNRLEIQLSEAAVKVLVQRRNAIEQINQIMEKEVKNNLFPSSKIITRGSFEDLADEVSMANFKEEFIKILHANRKKDQESMMTSVGPHRTDFSLFYRKNNMYSENCSTGEQKNLLISLILAEARAYQEKNKGFSPILLFDEIVAHLDKERAQNLFEQISEIGSQAWLTGTNQYLFQDLISDADFFDINDGKTVTS